MSQNVERFVNVDRVEDLIAVFGSFDENIKRIEEALNVDIVNRGNELKIAGDPENVDKAVRTLEGLLSLAARGEAIDEQRVRYLITLVREGNDDSIAQMAKDCLIHILFFTGYFQVSTPVDDLHIQRFFNALCIFIKGAEDCNQVFHTLHT